MSRFNKSDVQAPVTQPGTTTGETTTFEGGKAWGRDPKSQLLLTAVVNMVGEDTFYESAAVRDDRYRKLVRSVAQQDPAWMLNFVTWLRGSANMRSASVVAACEAVKARLEGMAEGFDSCMPSTFQEKDFNRRIIDAACQRPDEPGEVLAYWVGKYGKNIPKPVKRGVADAVARLYSGKAQIKYDSTTAGVRFGDVLEMTHAKPHPEKLSWQGDVFRYCIDVRKHPADAIAPASNEALTSYRMLMAVPVERRRALLLDGHGQERLAAAGMTWETLAGWLQGPMDKAAWEAIIPSMGAMALVRNLRNFDQAGVSDAVAAEVCARISDPEEIRRSRMFPYRMLSAQKTAPSQRWGHALDKALDAACQNIPELPGRTLVLVDTSNSMTGTVSGRSKIRHVDVGALFGVALAMRGNDVDLVGFADGVFPHNIVRGGSALREIEKFTNKIGSVGYGTQTVAAIRATYRETVHKRVVVITDGQAFGATNWILHSGSYRQGNIGSVSDAVPADVPLFGIDTTGYSKASIDTSKPCRFEIGGFSDAMFTVLGILSSGRSVGWPWEVK